jgi:hypothetical protein
MFIDLGCFAAQVDHAALTRLMNGLLPRLKRIPTRIAGLVHTSRW